MTCAATSSSEASKVARTSAASCPRSRKYAARKAGPIEATAQVRSVSTSRKTTRMGSLSYAGVTLTQNEKAAAQPLLDKAAALRASVRSFQAETEQDRRIPRALVDQLREAGLYRMLAPHDFGGLQVDLLTCFRAVELMAEGD